MEIWVRVCWKRCNSRIVRDLDSIIWERGGGSDGVCSRRKRGGVIIEIVNDAIFDAMP
jgi:hypothetical protein